MDIKKNKVSPRNPFEDEENVVSILIETNGKDWNKNLVSQLNNIASNTYTGRIQIENLEYLNKEENIKRIEIARKLKFEN